MIADQFIQARREHWRDTDEHGRRCRHTSGSPRWAAPLDNEENYRSRSSSPRPGPSRSRIRRAYDTPPRFPVWEPRSAAVVPPSPLQDMANADCIVLMGGNMAEAHPSIPVGR